MRVRIRHTTRLEYTGDVVEGVTDARLGPLSDAHQRWERFSLRVDPHAAVRRYSDGFHNEAHLVTVSRPHDHLEIVSQGEVHTDLADPFQLPERRPEPLSRGEVTDYTAPSDLVQWNDAVTALARRHAPTEPNDTFESVRRLMEAVHGSFSYRKDVTSVTTTVAEVMEGKAGVCQDFAHVMLALCRSLDIPARYVSGYIVSRSPARGPSQGSGQSMPSRGEGASHAWIEAFTPTHGWRGFDPTNNLVASEHHVKIAVGRDYRDVPPTRGTYRGDARETLTVAVTAVPVT